MSGLMRAWDAMLPAGSGSPQGSALPCGADRAGGRQRVIDDAVVDLDVPALIARHRQAAGKLVA